MTARSVAQSVGDSSRSAPIVNGTAAHNSLTAAGASSTETPLTSAKAAKVFGEKLTFYEKKEIEGYPEVYYAGQYCKNKVKAPASGYNNGYDIENGEYIIVEGDHIAYRYEIICHLGSGAFGQVVKALDHMTGTLVAVKLIRNKKKIAHQAKTEVSILEHIKERDPYGKYSIVQMLANFTFRDHICIVYELLGTNLYDHMESTDFYPMTLSSVRKVAARILVALTFLWKENMIHCDLKPENILYKTDASSDAVKVADLGSACYDSRCAYTYIQSRFYRAPEVILGLPYGRPIDLWSFGCILCELATGYPLFPGENEKDQIASIMEFLGKPPTSMITASKKKRVYFDDALEPIIVPNSKGRVRKPGSKTLASFLGLTPEDEFISFLNQFLCWDPEMRVPPRQAMKHPWIEEEFVFAVPPRKESEDVSLQPEEPPAAEAKREADASYRADGGKEKQAAADHSGGAAGNRNHTLPNYRGQAPYVNSRDEHDGGRLSSPKRFRPAMLTFDARDGQEPRELGTKGGDLGSSARSIISAAHHSVSVSVPPVVREARLSSSFNRSSNGQPNMETHALPTNDMKRAQPLSHIGITGGTVQTRRASVPAGVQGGASPATRTKAQTEISPARKGLDGSLSRTDSLWRAHSAASPAREGNRDKAFGGFTRSSYASAPAQDKLNTLLANARAALRPTGSAGHVPAETANCSANGSIGNTASQPNPPSQWGAVRGDRTSTAAMAAPNGTGPSGRTDDGGNAMRRRGSEGLPVLQATSFPLSSAPLAVPTSNRELREASNNCSKASPRASRRHEYAALRQAQRRRETVTSTVPDNETEIAQSRLPPL